MPRNSKTASHADRLAAAPRLLFYAGKGGAGKTTCAAGRAIAEARAGRRVLVLSTDPAHSLADALGRRLGPRPTRIRSHGIKGELSGLELNGPREFARWLATNRRALADVLERGTWLDRSDIDALLELSIPGVDELMALVAIARFVRESSRAPAYDLVVVDTAPTGHTLRLLSAPRSVATAASVLDDLQREHRVIRARFGRAGRPDAADRFIETLATQARDAGALLQDRSRSTFHLVTLPEELSIDETEDALAALERARIQVAEVVVNRVLPQGPRCPLCDPRRAAESNIIGRIRRLAGRRRVAIVRARVDEPRGVTALARIGEELTNPRRIHRSGPTVGSRRVLAAVAGRTHGSAPTAGSGPIRGSARTAQDRARVRAADMRLDLCARTEDPHIRSDWFARFSGARLLLFGGKGGVGKTTCAAATAIRLADADSSRRLLLLSTDPAHSLGDVLGAVLDDEPKPVRGAPSNLFARELDAPRALAGRRAEIESALEEITLTAGVAGDRTLGVREIVDLAPPGIDEVLGVVSVVNSLGLDADGAAPERSAFDVVVCDTAPTGHALRLLEMPDAAREWIQSLLRLLLKYRELVRPGKLAEQLVALSQSTRRLQALLRDPRQTAFVVVTRAAQVPRAETERLVTRVRALSLAIPATLVNAVTIDPPRCPWCRRVAAAERKIVTALSRSLRPRSRHCAIILTPLVAPPPRGVARLRTWAATWMPI